MIVSSVFTMLLVIAIAFAVTWTPQGNIDLRNVYNISNAPFISATEFSGSQNWTDNKNYPVACPSNTYVTQINDSITCTSLEGNPAIHETAKYVIWNEGNNYYAKNSTGSIEFSGTNASSIIQNALDSLTSGRTWKEKVILKGNFTIDSTIKIPSFTVLNLMKAKIKLANEANVNMFENKDLVAGNSNIEIVGGILDGNKAKQSNGGHGIYLERVSESKIEDCTIKNTYSNGIYFNICENNRIIKNFVTSTGDFGILYYDSKDAVIEQNIIDATENTGIYLDRLSGKGYSIISGNIVKNVLGTDAGIFIDFVEKVVISDNLVYNSSKGIFIFNSTNFVVANNVLHNNTGQGIFVDAESMFGIISGNQVTLSGAEGIRIDDSTCTNILIISNVLHNNNPNIKNWATQNITIKYNTGYLTENSGTATIANTTTSVTVNHGLSTTPSSDDIMVTPIESLGSASYFWVDSITSTQFTIHVNADPGQDVDFAWKAVIL